MSGIAAAARASARREFASCRSASPSGASRRRSHDACAVARPYALRRRRVPQHGPAPRPTSRPTSRSAMSRRDRRRRAVAARSPTLKQQRRSERDASPRSPPPVAVRSAPRALYRAARALPPRERDGCRNVPPASALPPAARRRANKDDDAPPPTTTGILSAAAGVHAAPPPPRPAARFGRRARPIAGASEASGRRLAATQREGCAAEGGAARVARDGVLHRARVRSRWRGEAAVASMDEHRRRGRACGRLTRWLARPPARSAEATPRGGLRRPVEMLHREGAGAAREGGRRRSRLAARASHAAR